VYETPRPTRHPIAQASIVNHPSQLAVIAMVLCLATVPATSLRAQDAAAERLYREGQRLAVEDTQAAIDAYALLLEQFPADSRAPAALLRTAELQRTARDAMGTDRALERLIADYGRTPEAAAAFLMRGEIQLQVAQSAAQLADARATLERVPLLFGSAAYPALGARAQARLLAGRISRMLGDDDRAEAAFLTLIEDEPRSAALAGARRALAALWIERGALDAALEMLERTVDEAADAPSTETTGNPLAIEERPAAAERRLLALIHRRLIRPLGAGELFPHRRRFASGLGLASPAGIAAHEDGRLLVVDGGGPTVMVLAPDGRVLARSRVRDAAAPWWDGERPTVASGDALVQPFGGRSVRLSEPGKGDDRLKGIVAVARGALGDRFVLARGQLGVLRYAVPARPARLLDQGKRQLADLARDDRGRIYALTRNQSQVWRIGIDRQAEPGPLLAGTWKRPVAIAVDGLGFTFVLDRANRRLEVLDEVGNPVTSLGPQLAPDLELRAPVDVAVDGSGRVYLADAKLEGLVVLE